ncbi:phosphoribosylformylglycinamidine synthase subunit PurQ [Candidatus Micrarchaeota archaeon]|nr:phosphoribosylformylglycinamidine synthase subunit PurQ [Candidatus Micrarchaeota archaeon]
MVDTKALILTGHGVNCEQELKYVVEKVGGSADIKHLNEVLLDPLKIKFKLKEPLLQFIKDGKLVFGGCNGFQVLVKMGLLPVPDFKQRVTLTVNDSGKYEDRWIWLKANKNSPCIFTKGIEYLHVPVRHGEGKFLPADENELRFITENNLHVLQYVNEKGVVTSDYPANPNGSVMSIAGICDVSGRIFGLMPHPEAFNDVTNDPLWTTGVIKEALGLRIFKNAVEYLKGL